MKSMQNDFEDPNEVETTAPYAIVTDDNGSVLFEKNADELMHPSSMAKLMTAEFVFRELQTARIRLSDEFMISEHAWRRGGAPSGDSTMYADPNSRVTIGALLQGMIIASGNDAAIALAEGMAGTEAGFAHLLNERARAIGLTRSTFSNATGLTDSLTRSTPRELALLGQHIIRNYPDYYNVFGVRDFTWNGVKQQNRNPLLSAGIGADGLKTGYTRVAGYGLVGSALQSGTRLLVVVNGLSSADERSKEAIKMLRGGFAKKRARLGLR